MTIRLVILSWLLDCVFIIIVIFIKAIIKAAVCLIFINTVSCLCFSHFHCSTTLQAGPTTTWTRDFYSNSGRKDFLPAPNSVPTASFYCSGRCEGRLWGLPRSFFRFSRFSGFFRWWHYCRWPRWSFGFVFSDRFGLFWVVDWRGFSGRLGLIKWLFVFCCFIGRFWFPLQANDLSSPAKRTNPPSTDASSPSTPQNSYQIFLILPFSTSDSLDRLYPVNFFRCYLCSLPLYL